MAVTPVFPMVLQQMVTYLTAREFETPRQVGDSLSLSYVEQPDASEAVFDAPSGDTIAVPVLEHRNQYVALLDNARESGFYLARVSLQSPGVPVAVNGDTAESNVESQSADEVQQRFEATEIMVAQSVQICLMPSGNLKLGVRSGFHARHCAWAISYRVLDCRSANKSASKLNQPSPLRPMENT